MSLLSGLNKQQLQAVTSDNPVILNLAGAGSGKTRVLTHRMAYLHQEKRVGTSNMLALTFTRLAAKEMKERVMHLVGKSEGYKLTIGTFHSFCVRVLKEWGHLVNLEKNFTIYDEDDRRAIIQSCIEELGYKQVKLQDALDNLYSVLPEDSPVAKVTAEYRYRLARNNALDLDGLLVSTKEVLTFPQAQMELQNRYRYVFVDEFQDTNDIQMEIINLLSPENLFVVGDDYQCQPPGTLIETPDGSVPIERLKDGDTVLAWNRKFQYASSTGYKILIGTRPYSGDLINVSADGKTTKATPNHKFLVRWTERNSMIWVTYLMFRSDRGYRVGWCQLFTLQGSMHLATRARLEKAEKTWILRVHLSKKDATFYESKISIQYGIPTCMFEPNGELYDNDVLSRIFSCADTSQGEQCLREHGMRFNLPFWPYPNHKDKAARPTYFECYASNILPDYMSIPLPGSKTKPNQWAPIKFRSTEYYVGPVYSLDVDAHHNYIADGLVTLNCIYGWRGSNVQNIIEFPSKHPGCEVIKLERNYRSTGQIVSAANTLIKHNLSQTEKVLITDRDGADIRYHVMPDDSIEAMNIADMIDAESKVTETWSDIAVLARTNRQLQKVKEVLDRRNIPSLIICSQDDIFKKDDIRKLMALIEAAINPEDNASVLRVINFPDMKIGDLTLSVLDYKSIESGESLLKVMRTSSVTEAINFCELLDSIRGYAEEEDAAGKLIKRVLLRLGLRNNYISKGLTNRVEDLARMLEEVQRWHIVQDTLGESVSIYTFLRWLKMRDIQEKLVQEKVDAVKLMTVHASKGLEFPVVFVIGMNQNVFPSKRTEDMEEERRLFYVAITRAKDRLYLTRPLQREAYPGGPMALQMESQFIREIELEQAELIRQPQERAVDVE